MKSARHSILLLGMISSSLLMVGGAVADISCAERVMVASSNENIISTSPDHAVLRTLAPDYFGFNLEWADFQIDLWDPAARRVKPDVIRWLQPFFGGIYRYPGGTGSNYLDWRETIGDLAGRPPRKHADWLPPFSPRFGFDEYLSFVSEVNGVPWVVLNIYGTHEAEGDKTILAENAAAWVTYARKRENDGQPRILRWELGNELDRGNTKWTPEKYADVVRRVSRAVKAAAPETRLVGMLQDWPAQKAYSLSEYNSRVMSGLRSQTSEFAHHLYYEGLHWETVSERMRHVCNSISIAHDRSIAPSIWITEHSRNIPEYKSEAERKKNLRETANLEAALIVAESYIAGTQVPEIKSLFLHSLGTANGPWPLFHSSKEHALHPSAVYWAIKLLRDSLLSNVLITDMQSRNDAQSLGKHDVRAALLADAESRNYSVWAINRSPKPSPLTLRIPQLKGRNLLAIQAYLSDKNIEANNYATGDRVLPQENFKELIFDARGEAQVVLPPNSVSTVSLKSESEKAGQ